jgi:hypothetical protein
MLSKKKLVALGAAAVVTAAVVQALAGGAAARSASPPQLTLKAQNSSIHVLPTPAVAKGLPALSTDLTYHGGAIMKTASAYLIFWLPTSRKLQDGTTTTSLSATYKGINTDFVNDYGGHGLANNNTQYSQVSGSTTTYIKSSASVAGSWTETASYPTSACASSLGKNCITDAQLQAEVTHAMSVNGWTPGPTHIFIVYTSSNETSCFDSTASFCAYTYYCAYHGVYGSDVIYANMPYADSRCQAPSFGQHFPRNADGDASANLTSHELTEAITDPNLDAWYDVNGEEIGDKCAWNFGLATWDGSLANEMWNGRFYDLQLEYDNHKSTCVDVGP